MVILGIHSSNFGVFSQHQKGRLKNHPCYDDHMMGATPWPNPWSNAPWPWNLGLGHFWGRQHCWDGLPSPKLTAKAPENGWLEDKK